MRAVIIVALAVATAASICLAAKHSVELDRDRVMALGAADRFLAAWQMRDQGRGLALVSASVKKRYTETQIREYLSGMSNPHHAAFEVFDGKRVKSAYEFRVRLFEHYTGEERASELPGDLRIRLVKVGGEDWQVDNLPGYGRS